MCVACGLWQAVTDCGSPTHKCALCQDCRDYLDGKVYQPSGPGS